MNKIEIGGYSRISKARARKLYKANKVLYFCPVKMMPTSMWYGSMYVQKERVDVEMYNASFENVCNHFEYYYCNNETGNYIAFYIKERGKS